MIIEDDPQVRRMLKRLMSRHFDAVYDAGSTDAAEAILSSRKVTHLVVDYHLGESAPLVTERLAEWRGAYPDISRVILLTGSRISMLEVPREVDWCISKGDDPNDILALLKTC